MNNNYDYILLKSKSKKILTDLISESVKLTGEYPSKSDILNFVNKLCESEISLESLDSQINDSDINYIINCLTPQQLQEGWKEKLAAFGLSSLLALAPAAERNVVPTIARTAITQAERAVPGQAVGAAERAVAGQAVGAAERAVAPDVFSFEGQAAAQAAKNTEAQLSKITQKQAAQTAATETAKAVESKTVQTAATDAAKAAESKAAQTAAENKVTKDTTKATAGVTDTKKATDTSKTTTTVTDNTKTTSTVTNTNDSTNINSTNISDTRKITGETPRWSQTPPPKPTPPSPMPKPPVTPRGPGFTPPIPPSGGGQELVKDAEADTGKFYNPEQERLNAYRSVANFNPFSGKFDSSLQLAEHWKKLLENKLSPAESARRKSEKQKYKIVYMQDGKKVEVFASSIRGVRRAAYGKNQFRVYDSKGSDITAYFKRLMNEKK